VVTGGIHPTDQRDGLADVGITEFVAMVGSHGGKRISSNREITDEADMI
jgi:hypothetical protein